MIAWEATGMSAKSRATQYRQWAVNAMVEAMQSTSLVDRETLLMIARQHVARAEKAELAIPAPNGCPDRAKLRSAAVPAGVEAGDLGVARHSRRA
jgi:hypothetical protein